MKNILSKFTIPILSISLIMQSATVNIFADDNTKLSENNISEQITIEDYEIVQNDMVEIESDDIESNDIESDEINTDTIDTNETENITEIINETDQTEAVEIIEDYWGRPSYVNATQKGNSITIEWYSFDACDGFIIYRSEEGLEPVKIGTVADSGTFSYTDKTAKKNTLYHYYVASFAGNEISEKQKTSIPAILFDEINITSVEPIYDHTDNYSYDHLRFTWKKNDFADGYKIFKKLNDSYEYEYESKDNNKDTNFCIEAYSNSPYNTYIIKCYKNVTDDFKNTKAVVSGGTTIEGFELPESVSNVFSGIATTSSEIKLVWKKCNNASGYEIFIYDNSSDKYEKVTEIKQSNNPSWTDKSLTPETLYKYRISSYYDSKWGRIYSKEPANNSTYTLPDDSKIKALNKKIKKGAKAVITSNSFKGGSSANTNRDYTWGRYGYVSKVSDFIDYKGRYTVASYDNRYVYIHILNNKLKPVKKIRIKRKYSKVGGVIGDKSGNYYIAWGGEDKAGKGGKVTFAVSKYTSKGKLKKTATFKGQDGYWDTQYAFGNGFEVGNCSMLIHNGTLICSYGKEMYSGHQANAVFCVNTKDMKVIGNPHGYGGYDTHTYASYTSHSFDQSVISLSDGRVAFADLGDAYSRGFNITISDSLGNQTEFVPFHFYGKLGENETNARLGGIQQVSTGIALVGTSGKSLKNISSPQQIFLQIINPDTGESILKGKKRTGTCCDTKVTDKGIIWFTNDSSSAKKPHVAALSNDCIAIFWENSNGSTYYTVVSATGKTVQNKTPMGKVGLNDCEEMKIYNDYAYWSTASGGRITAHKMKIGNVK